VKSHRVFTTTIKCDKCLTDTNVQVVLRAYHEQTRCERCGRIMSHLHVSAQLEKEKEKSGMRLL